ncbi:hypothetical protein [Lysinibacillus fusiformis]|uniref:Uncharacterized protein n=1 Tax=Lysinibacillus fusiformis TaxID=28031 RepID=A0A1H9AY36_9BACI|nr:hypothetical protein [Lysinibacillus fusiformis]SCX81772.1 hypothetical protein SAMN02787081_00122 [Lysinibacillus fusiformis]SEM76349.1 hypothetical protein SAMN02787103_00122 [Lysinibacillus fusiformis]SEP81435.1 hypothetical protein SAMN02787113_00636 [Lysinibacillus fusiformis]
MKHKASVQSFEREYKKVYIKLLTKATVDTAKQVDAYISVKKAKRENLECGTTVQQRFLSQ